MSEDEKALIAAIRATPTFGDETRNELLGLALQAADALEARVHPTVTDPRTVAHIECDCVPDLGPSHCHLCSERLGRQVSWAEAHLTVTDAEVEAVLFHRWSPVSGYCACREYFVTEAKFARHALEAARAVQPTTNPKETP